MNASRDGRTAYALLASIALAAGCGAEEPSRTSSLPRSPERLRLEPVVSGLRSPMQVTAADGELGRLYVVEQEGTVRVLEGGQIRAEPLLDIRAEVKSGGEQGLLALALHPDFPDDPRFYVHYTNRDGDTRVVEYRRGAQQAVRLRELLAVDQPYENHNGGALAFGPDGLLYLGLGDGGAAFDPEERSQDLGSRLGKLLRLDVDREPPEWQIAAYGLRNPWRFSFDRETGDLYIADVGQDRWEEIDFVPRGTRDLLNFGWDVYEGEDRIEDGEPSGTGRLAGPVAVYGHDVGCSVTGGFVYRGSRVPALRGRYLYGDYCSGIVWSLRVQAGEATEVRRERIVLPQLTSFGEDAEGELYLVSQVGSIYRLAGRPGGKGRRAGSARRLPRARRRRLAGPAREPLEPAPSGRRRQGTVQEDEGRSAARRARPRSGGPRRRPASRRQTKSRGAYPPPGRLSAMPVRISRTMRSAVGAVRSAEPTPVGITSTTSAPTSSSSLATVRAAQSRSTVVIPPGSGIPVPGAKAGSRTSTSTVRKTGPAPTAPTARRTTSLIRSCMKRLRCRARPASRTRPGSRAGEHRLPVASGASTETGPAAAARSGPALRRALGRPRGDRAFADRARVGAGTSTC